MMIFMTRESGNLSDVTRRVFNLLTIVSFALCVAVLVDWCSHPWGLNGYAHVRKRWENDQLITQSMGIQTSHGTLSFVIDTFRQPEGTEQTAQHVGGFYRLRPFPQAHRLPFLARHGFDAFHHVNVEHDPFTTQFENYGVTVPSWLVALLLGILPAMWLRRWLARRGRGPNSCPACGYDLRATPERCPECGAIPAPAKGVPT